MDVLQGIGVSGPLLVVLLALGGLVVFIRAVIRAWKEFLATIRGAAREEVDAHAESCSVRVGDEAFKREVREGFVSIAKDIRAVHERIDMFLQEEIERARRSRIG